MRVFLVRHAHSDPGDPDELRPLSARGRDEARTLAERLADHETPPRVVVSSPLLRARQTAQVSEPAASVGHQPDCSEIAIALTGSDPGFPTGGVVEIDLDQDQASG